MSTHYSSENQEPVKGNSPSEADYKRWLARRCNSGNWFVCFDDFLKILKIEPAWVLQRLINLGKSKPKTEIDRKLRQEGWVRCTVAFLERKTGLKQTSQDRILDTLRGVIKRVKVKDGDKVKTVTQIEHDRAYVELKNFGIPKRRYIRINLVTIEKAIDRASGVSNPYAGVIVTPDEGLLETPDEGSLLLPKEKVTKEKRVKPPRAGFGSDTPSNNHTVDQECRVAAKLLYDSLRANNRKTNSWDPVKWSDQFRLLRDKDKQSDWYELVEGYSRHCSLEDEELYGFPHVSDAAQFRKHVDWIRSSLRKITKTLHRANPQSIATKIVVSEKAAKLAEELAEEYQWPKGSADQLPVVVQQSLDNYQPFFLIMPKIAKREGNSRVGRFANHLDALMEPPSDFIRYWFKNESRRFCRWEDWSGVIPPITIDSNAFCKLGRQWAVEYCEDARLWDQLMEVIKGVKK